MTIQHKDDYRNQVISIWEKSVRATHCFLKPTDFNYYQTIISHTDFNSFEIYCSIAGDQKITGFIGVLSNKIEMLFLDPPYMGQGLGKKLLIFAINELKASEVGVNEQNTNAVKFYSKFGFEIYNRTPQDSAGKDYPILKMKLMKKYITNEL